MLASTLVSGIPPTIPGRYLYFLKSKYIFSFFHGSFRSCPIYGFFRQRLKAFKNIYMRLRRVETYFDGRCRLFFTDWS